MEVPFARPSFGGGESAAVAEVIASGWLTQGPRVQEFERVFADRVGAAEAVATSSCTTALQLALYASGVRPGDEVIVPSLSFIATANAAWHCGATPVFADIDPETCNLDPAACERAITERTRAVVPVHQLGLPADMDAFADLAERHRIAIVEDAACAVGALHDGRQIGSLGYPACFSFHPRKVITCGEGGMITTNDSELAERLRRLRQQAMDHSALSRHNADQVVIEHYPERGWNARMTDLQAAIGLCQMEILDDLLMTRRRLAVRYATALSSVSWIGLPEEPSYAVRTWQSFPVRLLPHAPFDVPALMELLLRDGIATRRGVMAAHLEKAYADHPVHLPHTEAAAREVILLPLFPDLGDEAQQYVVERILAHAAVAA